MRAPAVSIYRLAACGLRRAPLREGARSLSLPRHVVLRHCSTTTPGGGSSAGGDGDGTRGPRSLGNCRDCGGPLKGVPTKTPSSRYLHCESCNKLYVGSGGDEATKGWNLLKAEQRKSPPYPTQIAEYLDRFVVGQQQAKKTLAVGVYQHYRRLEHNMETGASSAYNATATAGSGTQTVQEAKVPRGVLYQPAGSVKNSSGSESNPRDKSNHAISSAIDPLARRGIVQQDEFRIASQELRQNGMAPYLQGQPPLQPPPQQPPRRSPPLFRSLPEKEPAVRLEKSNVLLVGPSGVGKTFLTQTLARVLDVPIALCDCTSMTQAGYVGEDVESVIQKLVQAAGGSAERAQQGIVFLDEIDKIAASHGGESHASYRDVSGEGVQHALLKLVEGTVVNVKSGRKGVGAQQDTVQVDTSDILFIASGAFTALDKVVGRRLDQKTLGFGSSSGEKRVSADDSNSVAAKKRDQLLAQADQGDLISFGMVPELVGRFPVLVPFHSFDEQMLVRVLTEPQNSLLAQLKLQFAIDNVDLTFSSEALTEVARMALERKTGARALRSILESTLLDAKFQCPGSDIESIHVSREAIRKEAGVEMQRRREPVQAAL